MDRTLLEEAICVGLLGRKAPHKFKEEKSVSLQEGAGAWEVEARGSRREGGVLRVWGIGGSMQEEVGGGGPSRPFGQLRHPAGNTAPVPSTSPPGLSHPPATLEILAISAHQIETFASQLSLNHLLYCYRFT